MITLDQVKQKVAAVIEKAKANKPNWLIWKQGIADGILAGAKDGFWDAYQDYGNRIGYNGAFQGEGWNDKTFKPKYDLSFRDTNFMYVFNDCRITDLKGIMDAQGVKFDLTNVMGVKEPFSGANTRITRLPMIDLSQYKWSSLPQSRVFYRMPQLEYIECIKFSEHGNYPFTASSDQFYNCLNLKELRIEGKITNDFYINECHQLTVESLMSIIEALWDYTGTETTGKLYIGSNNIKKLTAEQLAVATNKQWEVL